METQLMRAASVPLSILNNVRTHPGVPVKPLEPTRLWCASPPLPRSSAEMAGSLGLYHPIMQALSPPGSSGRIVTLPLAALMQGSVDVLVGVAAIGIALVYLLRGDKALAGSCLQLHGFQVALASTVTVQAACLGLAAAFWMVVLA